MQAGYTDVPQGKFQATPEGGGSNTYTEEEYQRMIDMFNGNYQSQSEDTDSQYNNINQDYLDQFKQLKIREYENENAE